VARWWLTVGRGRCPSPSVLEKGEAGWRPERDATFRHLVGEEGGRKPGKCGPRSGEKTTMHDGLRWEKRKDGCDTRIRVRSKGGRPFCIQEKKKRKKWEPTVHPASKVDLLGTKEGTQETVRLREEKELRKTLWTAMPTDYGREGRGIFPGKKGMQVCCVRRREEGKKGRHN